MFNTHSILEGVIECGELQINLKNGQELFIDPSYFGLQIGGDMIKNRWLSTMSLQKIEKKYYLINENLKD